MRLSRIALAAASLSLVVVACTDESETPVSIIAGKGGAGAPGSGAGAAGTGASAVGGASAASAGGGAGSSDAAGKGGNSAGGTSSGGAAGEAGGGEGGSAGSGTTGKGGTVGKGGAAGKGGPAGKGGSAGESAGAAGSSDGGAAGEGGSAGGPPAGMTLTAIETLAASSSCYKYQWKDRGQMPKGYVKGMAKVFARSVCEATRSDVLVVSKAKTNDDLKDALSWFNSNFNAVSMPNDVAGVDTLRHAYTLLIGLGMRESSGEHCVGRDASASNVSSESAEAGAFQTSYDSRGASVELPKLFAKYQADTSGCLLETFAEGVTCSAANWKNWGTGAEGLAFQKLEKECPAFATEYAAVMLRVLGGSKGHYGPLRTKAAEIRPECDQMLQQVQTLVEGDPAVCGEL